MAVNTFVLEAKVEELGEKCAQFTRDHGTDSPDLLMDYGRALFALAKSTSSLVDNQKMDEKHLPLENPKVKVAQLDEEGEEEEEEQDVNENENEQEGNVNTHEDNVAEGEDGSENAEVEAIKVGGKEPEEVEEESEAEDDFVAAFNVVDGARVLLEKQLALESDPDAKSATKKKLTQARELLGDISLEDDNAPQAVEDYTDAVKLKREIYGELSGQVSEAEFMLSLAYDAAGNPSQALEHLEAAATAAEAAKLPSAAELRQRADDLKVDIEQARKSGAHDQAEAKQVTAESISGRQALASAVQSLVSNANDISQLTRKRKRPAKENAESNNEKKANDGQR